MARGSITQRGDSFRVRVDYYDLKGLRRQVSGTAPSFRKAELLSTKLQAEVDRGAFLKSSKIKVEAFLNQWLEGYVKSTVGDKTLELYSYLSKKHLIPALGNIPMANLRPQHIQALYSEKLKQGLAPRTVQLIHVCLHKALSNAIKTGLLKYNPMEGVESPKVERHAMKTMTEDNITLFLNKARETEYYALFFTYLFTGLRRGEALSLRWSDINIPGAQLSVSRTMQFLNNEITFKQPKTASSYRQIALSPNTCVVLKVHREEQDAARKDRKDRGFPPAIDNDLVFCHADGSPYLPRTISHCWFKLIHRCGLDGIRLHDARHSHATLMLKNGTSPKVIQERLGHSSFSTTMNLYAHVSPGMQKQAVDRFDEMMVTNQSTIN
jgi:integrase